jgi:antitoxin ParD1/3/4
MPETITFRPTDEQGGFIQTLIEAGDYANQSEVIREGLRLLQEHRASSKLETLRRLINEGEKSPVIEGWTADSFLGRMKKKHNVQNL